MQLHSKHTKCFLVLVIFLLSYSGLLARESVLDCIDLPYCRLRAELELQCIGSTLIERGRISFKLDPYNTIPVFESKSYLTTVYIRPSLIYSNSGNAARFNDGLPEVKLSIGLVKSIKWVGVETGELAHMPMAASSRGCVAVDIIFSGKPPVEYQLEYTVHPVNVGQFNEFIVKVFNVIEHPGFIPPYFYSDDRYNVKVRVDAFRVKCSDSGAISKSSDQMFLFRKKSSLDLQFNR